MQEKKQILLPNDFKRFRPLRESPEIREQNATVKLGKNQIIIPLFVVDASAYRKEIPSLRGVFHLSPDEALEEARRLSALGYDKVLLFGVPDKTLRSQDAHAAWQEDNLVERTVALLKKNLPTLTVMTDVCLCAYTENGHCGLEKDGHIDNDSTLPLLARMAASHARAGADWVAPSAMMDGQVAAIRALLDHEGLKSTQIMGYSAKFASSFYGPFREAAGSSPSFGDRRSYQMDYRAPAMAVEEVRADLNEGAAAVMVKPAHTYLDVLARMRTAFPQAKIAAYHVSGEYMMLHAAAEAGLLDLRAAMTETLFALRRAGADWIITYGAEIVFDKAQ